MTDEELQVLLLDLESDRIERKASLSDPDRVCQAICAFANDMPNHQLPGVISLARTTTEVALDYRLQMIYS